MADMDFQGMMLDLIQHSSFNNFNGQQVRLDLETFRNLWVSCLITRIQPGIILRDLPDGIYNIDTLYILVAPGRERELGLLARTWHADEEKWIEGDEAASMLGRYARDEHPKILQVWWD